MTSAALTLEILPDRLAVAQLPPGQRALPEWATGGDLVALLLTPEETTIVCKENAAPPGTRQEAGWRALRVQGMLDFGLVGILAELASRLAAAGISLYALSTFSTDYLLVKEEALSAAVQALRQAGHQVIE